MAFTDASANDGLHDEFDRLVLDLDPGPGVGLLECAEVARLARSMLLGLGLDPLPVTSGSKGIHVYSALDGRRSSDEVSAVARDLARALEADHPGFVVSGMRRSERSGRVLIDWSQNRASKTTVAPYSLRGRLRPTVAHLGPGANWPRRRSSSSITARSCGVCADAATCATAPTTKAHRSGAERCAFCLPIRAGG